jgi:hypothetical protein
MALGRSRLVSGIVRLCWCDLYARTSAQRVEYKGIPTSTSRDALKSHALVKPLCTWLTERYGSELAKAGRRVLSIEEARASRSALQQIHAEFQRSKKAGKSVQLLKRGNRLPRLLVEQLFPRVRSCVVRG